MNRVQINELKRVRTKANDFINKRMKLCNSGEASTPPTNDQRFVQSFSSLQVEGVGYDLNDCQARLLNQGNLNSCPYHIENHDEIDIDYKKELANWVVNARIPAMHVNTLLTILKNAIPGLPKTCKTLLKTPKNAYENVISMCNGYYLHIGLENVLATFVRKHNIVSKSITIDVGIDGVNSTKSSDTELWPIMVNVVGYDEVLVVGCYFGSGKPKDADKSSEEFLTPFVTEVLEILKDGLVFYENEVCQLEFRAIIMDAPARAFIMNTLMYSGYNSCTKCIIPGTRISKHTIFHGVDYELRSDFTFRNRIHSNHHHTNNITIVEKLPIDCVKSIPIEPMHNVYLGVTKQLYTLWIYDRRKPYSISPKNIKVLTKRIINISNQLPSEFCRKPRSLKYLKRFKATEFRQYVLYTLIILLRGILASKYYIHFLKFHCAIRILCTPKDCVRNNSLANELLTDFVKEFGLLYGYDNMSHNVHSLLHLAQDVLNFNCPLDSYSAFKFENFLQYLKKILRNNYRVPEQIHNRCIEKSLVYDYKGDFQKRIKNNKMNKLGDYINIHIYDMDLSTVAPNNYILTTNGHVVEIKNIYKNCEGIFHITGTRVRDILPFYEKPVSSKLLNIFVSETGITFGECTLSVTNCIRKVARIKCGAKYFYLALLH